jgi:hypothetical protein
MGSYYTSCRRCGAEISGSWDLGDEGKVEPAEVTQGRVEHDKVCPCLKYEVVIRDMLSMIYAGASQCSECPLCGGYKEDGHGAGCRVAKLLR